jgi:tetratricopeptide (TPR) repeat protein
MALEIFNYNGYRLEVVPVGKGWRVSIYPIVLTAAMVLTGPAAAQRSRDYDWCFSRGKPSIEQMMQGCTAVIQSKRETEKNRSIAYNHRGGAYQAKGDLDRAIADYSEATRLDAKNAGSYYNRGNAYQEKGDLDRAIADYGEAIRLDPKNAGSYYSRGNAYQGKGDFDRAVADYNKATRLDPKLSLAYYFRGVAWREKGDLDRAIADYSKAIRLDPKNSGYYYNRGNAYRGKGDFDRTVADYGEAIRLEPRFAIAFYNRGLAWQDDKGDLDRAIADFTEAIRLDPKFAFAYNNRGVAYYLNGKYDRAIADFTEAIRLDPTNAFAYRGRGLAYLYSGTPAKALADVRQASELDQKDAYNALWVDIVGERNNVPSGLSQAISKIDMTAWPAPVIRLFLGQMTPAAVLAAADDADPIKIKGQVCEANFYSGEFALRQGAKDEAARLFRLAASDCPKNFDERGTAGAELKALGEAP